MFIAFIDGTELMYIWFTGLSHFMAASGYVHIHVQIDRLVYVLESLDLRALYLLQLTVTYME